MSVVGIDFGNESCVVAVARRGGIDVVLNEESNRETPAIVCFGDKQRFIGTAGAVAAVMNPKNSISQIKRLIGRRFDDPVLQSDLKSFPFSVTEGPDGFPLIHVKYLGEQKAFTPTQVFAMVLSNLKRIAEKDLDAPVADCCIGIPIYFTDLQRRAVLDATAIAGLHPLHLIHETTATALAYGIYKTDLPENGQVNVAFVDVGHASMQVCVAGDRRGQLKILGHTFDQSLGGRDFDEVLLQHFAAKFKQEYKIDVFENPRACVRLRATCEKLKKVLSTNPVAHLNIECLMDEKDVNGFIKREEFEQISIPILERVMGPLLKALQDAKLGVENIHAVELVGSGSRVPAIIKILTEFFGKEPRRTMNSSECVARGCALQCAICSPTFKVREFQVHENLPYTVALSQKCSTSEPPRRPVENQLIHEIFPKGNPIPSTSTLALSKSSTFSVDVVCTNGNEEEPTKICTYTVGPFQSNKCEYAELKLDFYLNLHGITSVKSATLLQDDEAESTMSEEVNEAKNMDTDEVSSESKPAESEVNMQNASTLDASAAGVENGSLNTEDKPEDKHVQKKTSVKIDAAKKKVKIDIPVSEQVYGGLSETDLQIAMERELKMALQDKVMEETKDRKNAVEAYVYDMRDKLCAKYQDFVTDSDREILSTKLQEVEDWLYEDGEDVTKGVYIAKFEELKKQGDPIEERCKEDSERGPAVNFLNGWIKYFRNVVWSNHPNFDHIDSVEKKKVLNECDEAERWLQDKRLQQDVLPKYVSPVLLCVDITRKVEALRRFCGPIINKPKPATPQTASHPTGNPQPQPQAAEQQRQRSAGSSTTTEPVEDDNKVPVTEEMGTGKSHSEIAPDP